MSSVFLARGWSGLRGMAAALGLVLFISSLASGAGSEGAADAELYWPQWRGPHADGVAPHSTPPLEWSESRNIKWKTAIPGKGHATPVIWGDLVYIQTAVETEEIGEPAGSDAPPPQERRGRRGRWGRRGGSRPTHVDEFLLLAVDRDTGEIAWEQELAAEVPHEAGHPDASQASNSPVTDGEYLIAFFGSRGLYCLDMEGGLLWQKDLGRMRTSNGFGEGASPVLCGNAVIVNWDHEGDSFVVAYDKRTGEELWKTPRDERTTWATPLIVEHEGKRQVVTAGTEAIRGYDPTSGKLLWQCSGLTRNVIPSPVWRDDLLFATSGYGGSALLAIRFGEAAGDITGTPAVAWSYDGKGTPYVPSPLLYNNNIYVLKVNSEILSCVDALSGKAHYAQQRLEGLRGVYSSPVGAAGRVYITGRNGVTAVIDSGTEFKQLATNKLEGQFAASAAIAGNEFYLRSFTHLYCIAEAE